MRNMKKVLKLFCFAFITFLMLGFGGEKVSAAPDSIKIKAGASFSFGNHSFWVKRINGGDLDNEFAFCLNSNKYIPGSNTSLALNNSILSSSKKTKVKRILKKAYELGLNETTNEYGLSQKEFYGVTQMAVWNAVYGTKKGGYISVYRNWVNKKTARVNLFNDLKKISKTVETKVYDITFSGSSTMTDTGEWLVSENQTVNTKNISTALTLIVQTSDTQISINGGEWVTTGTIQPGQTFKMRIRKPSDPNGTVTGSVNATSQEFVYDWNLSLYKNGSNSSIQSMSILTPKKKTVSKSLSVTSDYTNETKVSVKKVDSATNKKVEGAEIGLYRSGEQEPFRTIISTGEGKPDEEIYLPVGDYYFKETKAPKSYVLNSTPVSFSIVNDGGIIKVMQNNVEVSSATLSIENTKKLVRFRKVDSNTGEGIEGVRIEIHNFGLSVAGFSEEESMWICAMTDQDGYLTRPCTGIDNPSNYYQATGNYEIGNYGGIYYVKETFKDGYYAADFDDTNIDFYIDTDFVYTTLDYIDIDDENDIITVTLKNDKYIDVSKKSMTGSNEIPGAQMSIYDADDENNKIYFEQDDETGVIEALDSWVSTDEPHRFVGLEPNHTYVLVEDQAPEGYVKIRTRIFFEVDASGNVQVTNQDGELITDGVATNKYKLDLLNDYTKITISKQDMVTNEEVPGAHIKLCTDAEYNAGETAELDLKDYTCSIEWDSTDTPHEIDMLVPGDYYLIETIAPSGYARKTSAVKITVKEESGIQPFEFENQPIRIKVSKVDQVTGKAIVGAKLQILNAADRSVAKTNTGAELTWISDGNDWIITGLPVGDYILVEIDTPDGYEEGMIIGEDGDNKGSEGKVIQEYAFSITGIEDVEFELNVPVMNVPKTGLSTLNLFAIGGLLVFAGYETIKIYRKRVNS